MVKGKDITTYSVYKIELKATNSERTTKSSRYDFIAYDFDVLEVSLILGFP